MALIQNVRADELKPFLKKYNIETIESDHWYPEQVVLDFELAVANSEFNASENLVAIGMKLIETIPFAAEVKTFEDSISALNDAMRQIHMNKPAEAELLISDRGTSYLIVTINLPYPLDLMYGYLWALAKKYRPAGKEFSITAIENPQAEKYPGKAYRVAWQ